MEFESDGKCMVCGSPTYNGSFICLTCAGNDTQQTFTRQPSSNYEMIMNMTAKELTVFLTDIICTNGLPFCHKLCPNKNKTGCSSCIEKWLWKKPE